MLVSRRIERRHMIERSKMKSCRGLIRVAGSSRMNAEETLFFQEIALVKQYSNTKPATHRRVLRTYTTKSIYQQSIHVSYHMYRKIFLIKEVIICLALYIEQEGRNIGRGGLQSHFVRSDIFAIVQKHRLPEYYVKQVRACQIWMWFK